jgi:replication factor C subunit 3/5
MDPVRSRCLCVRVAAPSLEQVQEQLQLVAKKENFALPPPFAARLAVASQRNLRRALLMMEVARVQSFPFKEDQVVPLLDWEQYIGVSGVLIGASPVPV